MSPPRGRPKVGSLPLGGTARSAKGAPSLAVTVDAASAGGANRLTAAVGAFMIVALLVAAWDQWQAGLAPRQWLAALIAALACAAWCLVLLGRGRYGQSLSIRVACDGRISLVDMQTGESVDADVVMTWGLSRLIYLRVRPNIKVDPAVLARDGQQSSPGAAPGDEHGRESRRVCKPDSRPVIGSADCRFRSGDCRFLLARRSFSESDWHGLRRWLVWYRRSVHGESAVA